MAQLTRRQQPSPRTTFPFSSQPSIPLARVLPDKPAPPVGAPSPSFPFFFPVPRDSARRVPLPRSSLAAPWAACLTRAAPGTNPTCQPLPSVALLLETSPPEPGSAQGRCATRPARPRIAAAIPAGITLGTHAQDPRPPSFKHRPRPSAPPSHPAAPHNPSCRLASARSGAPPRPPRR